jgi:hypothetical protein
VARVPDSELVARSRITDLVGLKWVCFHKQSDVLIGDHGVRRLFLILPGHVPVSRTRPFVLE